MRYKQKIMFTPGPLNTSEGTKGAMQIDLGTRDHEFANVVLDVQKRILTLGHASASTYACVLLQGSGTYGVESVLLSAIGKQDKLLILANGSYGQRMGQIAEKANLSYELHEFSMIEDLKKDVIERLIADVSFTHVAFIHDETTAGVLNDLTMICSLCHQYKKTMIVDAMSSFGGIPIHMDELQIDYLITSSNKCMHGVPGIAVIIAKHAVLEACKGNCPSLSLDLYEQYKTMLNTGSFRFTSPTHVILALHQAIQELEAIGGVAARYQRYKTLNARIRHVMREQGFEALVNEDIQAPVITTFLVPANIDFEDFYEAMKQEDLLLYSGKLPQYDAFRIGNIGEIRDEDIDKLEYHIRKYREEHSK